MTAPTKTTTTAEHRNREATERQSKRAFHAVLTQSCHAHRVGPGVPCWTVPTANGTDRPAYCGERIRGAGYVGRISSRWETARPNRNGQGS